MAGGIGKAASGDQYRIGPLTTYVDTAELEAWHRDAALGDEIPYAVGPIARADAPASRLARAFADRGEATLFCRREAGRLNYMIRKRQPAVVAAALPAPLPRLPIGPEQKLYETLAEIASDGLPLPSLEELAERAGLSDRHAARYRLRLLTDRGLVRLHGEGAARVAEIVATGARTARIGKDRT